MLSVSAIMGVFCVCGNIGCLVGFAVKRPASGFVCGIGAAIMTVALGILFGPVGYCASIGLQVLSLSLVLGIRHKRKRDLQQYLQEDLFLKNALNKLNNQVAQ